MRSKHATTERKAVRCGHLSAAEKIRSDFQEWTQELNVGNVESQASCMDLRQSNDRVHLGLCRKLRPSTWPLYREIARGSEWTLVSLMMAAGKDMSEESNGSVIKGKPFFPDAKRDKKATASIALAFGTSKDLRSDFAVCPFYVGLSFLFKLPLSCNAEFYFGKDLARVRNNVQPRCLSTYASGLAFR